MARDPTPHLDRARGALGSQDYDAARDALIAAWQCRRSPVIATLVDLVAERAPDALTTQLAQVVTPRVATSHANLKALAGIVDPRVSGFAIEALVRLPFTARTARKFLADLISVVETLDDARIVPHVDAIAAGLDTRLNLLGLRRELVAQLRGVVKAMKPLPATPLEDALAKIVEPLRKATRSAEALLADIHANPDDDGPRLVLADLLLERGDPRGELITLQIERGDGEPTERETELLKKHGRAWLGNLAPVLSWGRGYSHTKFRRGFVAVADIILSVGKKLEPIRRDPAWSTVEELTGSWDTTLLLTAPLPALRLIDRGLDAETISKLAAHGIELVGVRQLRFSDVSTVDPRELRAVFPNYERMLVHHRAPQSRRLELFEPFALDCLEVTHNWVENDITGARAEFDAYVAGLVGTTAPIARLILQPPSVRHNDRREPVELRRNAHGRFERV